jgi:hypothetical protein
VAQNVRRQIDVADKLINLGFAPFVPLLSHFQHMIYGQPYEKWCELDIEWLNQCDCVLRLEGESVGADKEVEHAQDRGMYIFYNIISLIDFYNGN